MYTHAGLRKRYAKRIARLMKDIAGQCRAAGLFPGRAYPMTNDSYQWWLTVKRQKNDQIDVAVDIIFTICESEEYDVVENGVNFSIDIVECGGRILGGFTPYNYTDKCWIDLSDLPEIDERFNSMLEADITSIPNLIKK
jgi:hypothetical protein